MFSLRQAFQSLDRGQLVGRGDELVASVSTDSRQIQPGGLFVAVSGENFDAHHFAIEARKAGAAALLIERWMPGLQGPAIIVPDTRRAYGQIARGWREQFSLPVISVSGSNGKTTTKEMIASILAAHFGAKHFLATRGNLNNDIGVPQTLLMLNTQHQAAVIELGTNHPGEIAELAHFAGASVALVTNAQREHQEFLQGVEGSAYENGASFEALASDGIAIYPGDDHCAPIWEEQAGARRTMRFGLSEASGHYEVWAEPSAQPESFDLHLGSQTATVGLQISGRHNVRNALAAAACCHAIGLPLSIISTGLAAFQPASGRLVRYALADGRTLIDDSYNANPDSVRAAIEALASLPAPRTLVLGDMGEVGEQGDAFHREVGVYAAQSGIEKLFALGPATRASVVLFNLEACLEGALGSALPVQGQRADHFETAEQIVDALKMANPLVTAQVGSVLVKGSRFMKMERVIAGLGIERKAAPSLAQVH